MRVGILALSARAYGGDTYFRAFLPWLDRLGGDAEYLVFTRDRRYASLPLTDGRVRLVDCGAKIRGSTLHRLLWEQLVLPRVLRGLGIDVLYTASNLSVLGSPCPTVISIRNMEPLAASLSRVPGRLRARLVALRALTRASMRKASRIIAVSEYVRDFLLGIGVPSEKLRVVYHGVDLGGPILPAAQTLPRGFVFSSSKFVRYANLETLIRGYYAMCAVGVAEPLIVAGGPWDWKYEAEMRALVQALNLNGRVRFVGYVAHDEMLSLLSASTIFVFSSILEACPFTLLEAMACGATILTTRVRPMPEFCADAARYFDPLDGRALAAEGVRLLRQPDERERLRAVAKMRAREYTWERSVLALLSVLRETSART